AGGAGGRRRELGVAGDRPGEVGRGPGCERNGEDCGEEEGLEAHHRYPLSCTRKVVVAGPWPQRSTTSARTSRWGITNHHSPPHTPRWSSGVDPVFIPSSAPKRWNPRRGSRAAWSHSAWPTSWTPLPSLFSVTRSAWSWMTSGRHGATRAKPPYACRRVGTRVVSEASARAASALIPTAVVGDAESSK